MAINYQFPLFDSIVRGSLSPFSAANHADTNYRLRMQEQVVSASADEGRYALHFPPASHPKQEYYRRLLAGETFAYCNDLRAGLLTVTNSNIRAYYRDIILDKHLTTCLQHTGELIAAVQLSFRLVQHPSEDTDTEEVANTYCLHLLKACVAKAYLEVQDVLSDVVSFPMSENELYCTYLHELNPVQTFLKKRLTLNTPVAEKKQVLNAVAENKPAPPVNPENAGSRPELLTTKEVAAILKMTEKTVIRKLEKEELKGLKIGRKWRIEKNHFENYLKTLTLNK